jgi:hypothetical protein
VKSFCAVRTVLLSLRNNSQSASDLRPEIKSHTGKHAFDCKTTKSEFEINETGNLPVCFIKSLNYSMKTKQIQISKQQTVMDDFF